MEILTWLEEKLHLASVVTQQDLPQRFTLRGTARLFYKQNHISVFSAEFNYVGGIKLPTMHKKCSWEGCIVKQRESRGWLRDGGLLTASIWTGEEEISRHTSLFTRCVCTMRAETTKESLLKINLGRWLDNCLSQSILAKQMSSLPVEPAGNTDPSYWCQRRHLTCQHNVVPACVIKPFTLLSVGKWCPVMMKLLPLRGQCWSLQQPLLFTTLSAKPCPPLLPERTLIGPIKYQTVKKW